MPPSVLPARVAAAYGAADAAGAMERVTGRGPAPRARRSAGCCSTAPPRATSSRSSAIGWVARENAAYLRAGARACGLGEPTPITLAGGVMRHSSTLLVDAFAAALPGCELRRAPPRAGTGRAAGGPGRGRRGAGGARRLGAAGRSLRHGAARRRRRHRLRPPRDRGRCRFRSAPFVLGSVITPRARSATVKYMLLINDDPSAWARMSEEQVNAVMSEYFAFSAAIREEGIFVAGDALKGPEEARTVRVRDGQQRRQGRPVRRDEGARRRLLRRRLRHDRPGHRRRRAHPERPLRRGRGAPRRTDVSKPPPLQREAIGWLYREWFGRAVGVLARSVATSISRRSASRTHSPRRSSAGRGMASRTIPGAWIIRAARNRAIDRLRRRRMATERERQAVELEALRRAIEPERDSTIPDERLGLMFACCHPSLAPEASVALTCASSPVSRSRRSRAPCCPRRRRSRSGSCAPSARCARRA